MTGDSETRTEEGAGDPSLREELASAFAAERRAAEARSSDALAPETPAPERLASEPRNASMPKQHSNGTGVASESLGPDALGPEALAPAAPPPSFSAEARAEWANVPDAVKQAIAKREREVDSGFKQYAGLGQFMKLAQATGTNLAEALERYVAAERLLSTEPVKGILTLCHTYNVSPQQIAAASGATSGGNAMNGAAAGGAPANDLAPLAATLARELGALQNLVLTNQREQVLSEVDSFFADKTSHPFAGDVAADMARLLSLGACSTLREAYEAACWNNHEVRGRLINAITTARTAEEAARAKTAADQARAAGQSITGGPAATPPPGPPETDDLREQLRQAFAAARLA